ncbi:MAG: hypothetical protein WD175_02725 [Candidatus Paceibacterota bacterium]
MSVNGQLISNSFEFVKEEVGIELSPRQFFACAWLWRDRREPDLTALRNQQTGDPAVIAVRKRLELLPEPFEQPPQKPRDARELAAQADLTIGVLCGTDADTGEPSCEDVVEQFCLDLLSRISEKALFELVTYVMLNIQEKNEERKGARV